MIMSLGVSMLTTRLIGIILSSWTACTAVLGKPSSTNEAEGFSEKVYLEVRSPEGMRTESTVVCSTSTELA
jgi:hypothetical protein